MARRFGIFREFLDATREGPLKKRPPDELHVRTSFAERSEVGIQRFGNKALRTGGQLERSSVDASLDDASTFASTEVALIDRWRNGEIVTEKQLENLVNSLDPAVRESVAKRGLALDRLMVDENPFVRAAVAEQRYGLDVLVRDADPYVRAAVARQGCGLDILRNDRSLVVQDAVWDYEHNGDDSRTVSDIVADAGSRDFGVSRGNKEKIEMEFC